jgi:hypothetical protein
MALFAHLRRVIDKDRFIEGHHQTHFGLKVPGGTASLTIGSHPYRCAAENCGKSFNNSADLWKHYTEMGVPGFEQGPEAEKPATPSQAVQDSLKLIEESGPPDAALASAPCADLSLCSVCMDKPPEVVMVPCGHIYACEPCGKKLRECALCREPVAQVLRVYYSTNQRQ